MSGICNAISDGFGALANCFTSCYTSCCEENPNDYSVVSQDDSMPRAMVMERGEPRAQEDLPSLEGRTQMIDLSESDEDMPSLRSELPQVESQVLEGRPGSFYIGAQTPKSVCEVGAAAAEQSMPSHAIEFVKHPHTTLGPPNESLHPSKPTAAIRTRSLKVGFDSLVLTDRGNLTVAGPKTEEYVRVTRELAEAHGGEATNRSPHSIIGRVTDAELVEKIFANPAKYGFEPSRDSEHILVKKLGVPQEFQVNLTDTRPVEQRLLAKAYGEDVNLKKPLSRNLELESSFIERQQRIVVVQAKFIQSLAKETIPKCPAYHDPVQFTYTAMILATEGHEEYGRIPLTFSLATERLEEGVHMWVAFRGEVSTTLVQKGYDDADVSVLGSAVSGFSGNPTKPFKTWTRNSDVDCAIFSTKLAAECLESNGKVNSKIQMMGKLTVFKNAVPTESSKVGFHDLPVGKDFVNLQRRWTEIIYGEVGTEKPQIGTRAVEVIEDDEVDFKLNIGDVPFRGNAITFHAASHAQ